MTEMRIRPARREDLPRLTAIYNHYAVNTPVTFDSEPQTVERRAAWFAQFAATVETTIYCGPEATGKGIGRRLYAALFAAIAGEDIRRILAGYALPNPASAALHERFGFRLVGVFSENGRKFGRYWDVAWTERPLRLPGEP
jgi:phosphinothricin acetyltransferase